MRGRGKERESARRRDNYLNFGSPVFFSASHFSENEQTEILLSPSLLAPLLLSRPERNFPALFPDNKAMTVKIVPEAGFDTAAAATSKLRMLENQNDIIVASTGQAGAADAMTKARPSSAPSSRDAPASLSAFEAMDTFTPRTSKVRSGFCSREESRADEKRFCFAVVLDCFFSLSRRPRTWHLEKHLFLHVPPPLLSRPVTAMHVLKNKRIGRLVVCNRRERFADGGGRRRQRRRPEPAQLDFVDALVGRDRYRGCPRRCRGRGRRGRGRPLGCSSPCSCFPPSVRRGLDPQDPQAHGDQRQAHERHGGEFFID